MFRAAALLTIAALAVAIAPAEEYGKVTSHKVADGVYLFTTTPYADVGFCGNVTAVVGDDGVLVFDSGATPKTAEAVIAELRRITDKPVRYLVNSHWHWDHWGGNEVFVARFPGLQLITSAKNRQMMTDIEPRWNDKGLHEDLPRFVGDMEKQLATAKASRPMDEKLHAAELRVAADRDFLTQKQNLRKTIPTATFTGSKIVRLGRREVQLHGAMAITPGDTYVYLPRERVLITGDIVLNPYPYAIGGTYPKQWVETLKKLIALDPQVVIPGHGEPAGKQLLADNLRLMETVRQQVASAKQQNLTADQTAEEVVKNASALAAIVGVKDEQKVKEFQSYFLDTFVRRAWKELDGELGDVPDGIN